MASQSWRLRQIRLAASGANWLYQLPPARRLISLARNLPGSRAVYRWSLGYNQAFNSLEEADEAVSVFAYGGHEHPENVSNHLDLNRTARPSDYAALYHLQRLLPGLRRVFDLGGNVGNLFYCYSTYLSFDDLHAWQVLDLPANMERGRVLSASRGAQQLIFVDDWKDADGADLLLISGALHYMRRPLADMISDLTRPPDHILINRTPLTEGAPFAAVQDGGAFRVACMVHNRAALIEQLESHGYELRDSWQAAELSLTVPADPQHTIPAYSGLLFRRV